MVMRVPACALVLAAFLPHHAPSAFADAGDWWCSNSRDWSSQTKIPVWIDPDLAENLKHSDVSPWTDDELRREVEFALERIMDQAPTAMPPLYYAGTESIGIDWLAPAGNGAGGYNISLRPNRTIGPEPEACFSETLVGTPGSPNGVRIVIETSTYCPSQRWDH
jgi:hypothetical protein